MSDATYVALTEVSVPVPASSDGFYPACRHLVGFGLLIARRTGQRWAFRRLAGVIPAGEPESVLLEWLTRHLPEQATLIGWNVDHGLMPLLLDAARGAPPTIAHAALERLLTLMRPGIVDLALPVGGAGAPPFAGIAIEQAIYAPGWDAAKIESAWATGRMTGLRHDLADEAIAMWRLFLRRGGLSGVDAEAATDAWVERRRRHLQHQLRHQVAGRLRPNGG